MKISIDERYWRRADNAAVTREHMLMALSDVQALLIKASFTTNTQQTRISRVTLDVASEAAPVSNPRAYEVEEVRLTQSRNQ